MFNLIVFFLTFVVLSAMYRGWVLTVLWGWFIVPLGVPAISIASALGIVLIITMLTHQHESDSSSKAKDVYDLLATVLAKAFAGPTITLLFGYIISLFV